MLQTVPFIFHAEYILNEIWEFPLPSPRSSGLFITLFFLLNLDFIHKEEAPNP